MYQSNFLYSGIVFHAGDEQVCTYQANAVSLSYIANLKRHFFFFLVECLAIFSKLALNSVPVALSLPSAGDHRCPSPQPATQF